ncbi:polysaccharide deacetylase family protein [Kribbella sp. ALI-6-A]|uniref:polysaccharide deacetylase family protein n=1 Tax=Kribbella sp. ALI-6-A TaxID=1933817 RepID=UPI000A0737A1|nr:polysaccharide deacetylase family protein [Kribbella sp. ALI-6-A]
MVLRHPPDRRPPSLDLSGPRPPGRNSSTAVALAALVVALVVGLGTAAVGRSHEPAGQAAAAPPPAPALPAKYVVLTFDDGPDPRYTPQILDILDRYGAKATFFVVGAEVKRHPELARRLHERGHSVQNHTWSHANLSKLSWSAFERQVKNTDAQIQARTGLAPGCLRPPYGARNGLVDRRAAALGKQVVLWDIDSRDWTRPGVAAIERRVPATVRNGSVILFHDGGGDRAQTIAALPKILKTLTASGFGFRTAACDPP